MDGEPFAIAGPVERATMNDISAAIAAARTGAQLDAIARDITAAWGKGTLADDIFTAWYGAIHRRRAELRERRERPPALGSQEVCRASSGSGNRCGDQQSAS